MLFNANLKIVTKYDSSHHLSLVVNDCLNALPFNLLLYGVADKTH